MTEQEEWRDIPEWVGLYQISSRGSVRGVKRKKIKKLQPKGKDGYMRVQLRHRNRGQERIHMIYIHIMVARVFLGLAPVELWEIEHKDGRKQNNHYDNLMWVSHKRNMELAEENGQVYHPDKAVHQLRNGVIIQTFPSLKEAAQAVGVTSPHLSNVIAGRGKTVGGFEWQFVDESHAIRVDEKDVDGEPFPVHPSYLITREGRIYSTKQHKFLKPQVNAEGYHIVGLRDSATRKQPTFRVNRLVALTYLPNPDRLPIACHKNGEKGDNRLENLVWGTHAESSRYYQNTHTSTHGKSVKQIDPQTGEVLRVYRNIQEAFNALGRKQNGSIGAACDGKRELVFGFKWAWNTE